MQPQTQAHLCRRSWLHSSRKPCKARPKAKRRLYQSTRVMPWTWADWPPGPLRAFMDRAWISEVRVHHIATDLWHLIGRHRSIDVTTALLEAMSWDQLHGLHQWLPETRATRDRRTRAAVHAIGGPRLLATPFCYLIEIDAGLLSN